MPRRLPAVGVAAAAVAGAALWFTRATLDVVSTARGVTRVAMLPSWPELLGLTLLASLLLVLARALVQRVDRTARPHAPGWRRSVPPDVLVPLFIVSALALPYLPWLADVVPALTALSGPGASFVWAVALGHVAWVAWDVWLHRRVHAWRIGGWPGALVVGLVTAGLAVAAAARLAAGPLAAIRERTGAAAAGWPTAVATWLQAAADGDRGVVVALGVVTALVAALQWRAAARLTGSSAAATLSWLAVVLPIPLLLAAFGRSPAILVALAVLVGTVGAGDPADMRAPVLGVRSAALGTLPWLGLVNVPVSLVLACLLTARAWAAGASMAWASLPYAGLAGAAAFAIGSPSPPGAAAAAELGYAGRTLAPLFDQEHGVLVYVPALLAAGPGLWRLWRDGGGGRRHSIEIALAATTLLLTVAAVPAAWPHPYIPGAALVPVLPLLGLAIARWDRHVEVASVRRGLLRLLVVVGLAITASVLLVRDGSLLVANRDGIAELLVWLSPTHELARIVPSLASPGGGIGFWIAVGAWVLALVLAGWTARRWRSEGPGRGAVVATAIALAALLVPAVLIPVLARGHVIPAFAPAQRAGSSFLQGFDARRRPYAIVYDPLRIVAPSRVPSLYSFDATPGSRRYPQPLRVLLNARLSLPAGTYRAVITPRDGSAVRGGIGLQVGRIGPPLSTWTADEPPGHPWTGEFRLDVDAAFVGLRTSRELEAAVASLHFQPIEIVDESRRASLPPVLAASRYHDVTAYFHDEHAYAEPDGFWVRGRTTLLATLAWNPEPARQPGVTLKLHSGAAPNEVTIATSAWHTTVELQPGITREVRVPARPGQSLLHVRFSPADGFVPAERGGSDDRRVLGSWVEILR